MANQIFLLIVLYLHQSFAIFFSQFGFGSMNCQCQSSCSSPPSQIGCLCPAPMTCFPQPAQSFYTPPPSFIYPTSYQSLQPSPSYLANIPPFMPSYAAPSSFISTRPSIQVQRLPPGTSSGGYPSSTQTLIDEQSIKAKYSESGPPGASNSADALNLQPPALKLKEDAYDQKIAEKTYAGGGDRPLSDIFYDTDSLENENEIDHSYSPVATTTESLYTPTEAAEKPGSEALTYSTSTTGVPSKRHDAELIRGEGSSDISMSGYGFQSASTSPTIVLEFLEQPRPYENVSHNNTDPTDITDFTKEVNEFYKSSTSNPVRIFEYGAMRGVRESTDIVDTTTPKFPFDREEITASSGKWSSKRKIREKEQSNTKCNNTILKDLMEMKMTSSPSVSKQMIYSAATELWAVVTSPVFCEHRKKTLTCFVFFQP